MVMLLGSTTPAFASIIIENNNKVSDKESGIKSEVTIDNTSNDDSIDDQDWVTRSKEIEKIEDEKLRAREMELEKDVFVPSDVKIKEETVTEDPEPGSGIEQEEVLYNGMYTHMVEPKELTQDEFNELQEDGRKSMENALLKESEETKNNNIENSKNKTKDIVIDDVNDSKSNTNSVKSTENNAIEEKEKKSPESDIIINHKDETNIEIQTNKNGNTTINDTVKNNKKNKSNGLLSFLFTKAYATEPGPVEKETKLNLPEKDGYKIEWIKTRWIDGAKDHREEVWRDDNSKSFRIRTSFALSGQRDFDPGTITIEIPKQIFKTREGKMTGTMSLGVPALPGGEAEFAYLDTGHSYIFINIKKLSAASQGMFECTIRGITPHEIMDRSGNGDKPSTIPFDAFISITTQLGNTISLKSNELDVKVDTRAIIESASKTGQYVYEEWPLSWPQELKPKNPDDYVYVAWNTSASRHANQLYKVDFLEQADNGSVETKNAKILGIRRSSDMKMFTNINSSSYEIKDFYPGNGEFGFGGGDFSTTTYVAYPKENFFSYGRPKAKSFDIKNNVKYTLTSIDDKEVTSAIDEAVIKFVPIVSYFPGGHFIVNKHGYGDYPIHLNYLKGFGSDKDVRPREIGDIGYNISTVAFGLPWTSDTYTNIPDPSGGSLPTNENNVVKIENNFEKIPYEIIVRDYKLEFNGDNKELDKEDFTFESLDIDRPTMFSYGKFSGDGYGYKEVNGKITSSYIYQGQYGYYKDNSAEVPDLEVLSSTDYEKTYFKVANVSFKNGKKTITPYNGAKVDGNRLVFPDKTTDYKVITKTAKAGINWNMDVKVKLKPSAFIGKHIDKLFKNSTTPSAPLVNYTDMNVKLRGSDNETFINTDSAKDVLDSFTYKSSLNKTSRYQNDVKNQNVKLHYKTTASISANEYNKSTVAELIGSGYKIERKKATFYDLLPKGVTPDTSTIGISDGNTITNIELIKDFRGTDKAMLKVSVLLSDSFSALNDSVSLEFDANYPWTNITDVGATLKNHVAFEVEGMNLGNTKGGEGEYDNPCGRNNVGTPHVFDNSAPGTKEAFTKLNESNKGPSFLYASCQDYLAVDRYALTSLRKHVAGENGIYGDGLDEYDPVNVYENQEYTYRLRIENPADTIADNIVLYDALEGYNPTEDKENHKDTQWKGTLVDVDVSQLEYAGAKPVVYYSTKKNIKLDDTQDRKDNDLSASHWSTTMPEDRRSITAIAIDVRHNKNGNKFVLKSEKSLSAIVTMRAPDLVKEGYADKDENRKDWYDKTRDVESVLRKVVKIPSHQKYVPDYEYVYTTNIYSPESGNAGGAHAYNNAVVILNTMSKHDPNKKEDLLIRHDYTKVGLKPYSMEVKKEFNDDKNRDGYRPEEITINVLKNGEVYKSAVLNDKNSWKHLFEGLLYIDENGKPINYSFTETFNGKDAENRDKYKLSIIDVRFERNMKKITLENLHEPEKVSLKVNKTWEDKTGLGVKYPKSITYVLKADGKEVRRQTVTPNKDNDWSYEFTNLFKFKHEGQEIVYTVDELPVDEFKTEIDGNNIKNTYYPYGDLKISKTVTNASKKAIDNNVFAYTLYIDAVNEKDENRFVGDYAFEKSNGETGKLTNGSKFTLKSDENIVIKDIDSRFKYRVVEDDISYFTPNQKEVSGTISASDNNEVAFINDYNTKGDVSLSVKKDLDGRKLRANQFMFEVRDTNGNIVSTGYNDTDGNVSLSPIYFTNKDLGATNGILNATVDKEYTITEVDRNKEKTLTPGYTYDPKTIRVRLKLVDDGKGKINIENIKYSDGKLGFRDDTFTYDNKYKADGEVVVKAWKFVKHNKDDDYSGYNFNLKLVGVLDPIDDFSKFNALDKSTWKPFDDSNIINNRVHYSMNNNSFNDIKAVSDKDGNIVFDVIKFNQYDAGKTFVFDVAEVPDANKDDLVYDTNTIRYAFTVYDDGRGKLSFESHYVFIPKEDVKLEDHKAWAIEVLKGFNKDASEEELKNLVDSKNSVAEIAELINSDKNSYPLFINKFKPGSLKVSKTVQSGDKDKFFKFKIKLTNKDGEIPDGEYQLNREYEPWGGIDFIGEVSGKELSGKKNDTTTELKDMPFTYQGLRAKARFADSTLPSIESKYLNNDAKSIQEEWEKELAEGGKWLEFRDNKYTSNGKPRTFYVSKKPLAKNVSWNNLFDAGYIYGWDTINPGKTAKDATVREDANIEPGYTPTIITGPDGKQYIVRLLQGKVNYGWVSGEDGTTYSDKQKHVYLYNNDNAYSEWNRVILPITKDYRYGSSTSSESYIEKVFTDGGQAGYLGKDKNFDIQFADYNYFGDLTLGAYYRFDYTNKDGEKISPGTSRDGTGSNGQYNWTQEYAYSGSYRSLRGNNSPSYGAAYSYYNGASYHYGYYGARLVLEPLND